jgi:NAD(P)-dependent dehydrogenase (short-subunit alcohol dehydrogenase family)
MRNLRHRDSSLACNVPNADVGRCTSFITVTDELWQQAINENLLPAVRLDRGLLPSMIALGSGALIHISSIQRGFPLHDSTLAYATVKAALTNYNKALSNEVSPTGVRVVIVSSGLIETDAATRMIERMAEKEDSDYATPWQKLMDMPGGTLLGRPTGPRRSPSWSSALRQTGRRNHPEPSSSSTMEPFELFITQTAPASQLEFSS